MTASPFEYKYTGLQRILVYKDAFKPPLERNDALINKFVNVFCEYQLADNNYMNIHFEASIHKDDKAWYSALSLDQVLQLITYIIWTDKFLTGYLYSKIEDDTMFNLLERIEKLQPDLVFSPAAD